MEGHQMISIIKYHTANLKFVDLDIDICFVQFYIRFHGIQRNGADPITCVCSLICDEFTSKQEL